MPYFYFFQNDKECKWMLSEINEQYKKYLYGPIAYEEIDAKFKKDIKPYESKKKFYVILDWVQKKNHQSKDAVRGGNPEWIREMGVNVAQSVKDLPGGAGIYITGYDSNLLEIEEAKRNDIPIIDNACPWVRRVKNQLLEVNADTHQCVFMIDTDHMVYECYKSILPDGTIIISPDNYREEMRKTNGKPICLIIYAVYRPKEVQRVIEFIDKKFPNENNALEGYKKTLCCWVHQGILEEIENKIKEKELNKIWVVCSSEGDRSTRSVLNEIKENGADCALIKKEEDIPEKIGENDRIGVLLAPVPVPSRIKNILNVISMKFGGK